MDSFTLQLSAHRIGGGDIYRERVWGPWSTQILTDHRTTVTLPGRTIGVQSLTVHIDRVTLVRPGLCSVQLDLCDEQMAPVGPPRAAFINMLPSDVPLYSSHIANNPDQGVYSVGLILPRSVWTPADLDTVAESVAA